MGSDEFIFMVNCIVLIFLKYGTLLKPKQNNIYYIYQNTDSILKPKLNQHLSKQQCVTIK